MEANTNTNKEKNKKKRPKFSINDNTDILIEILTRLDYRSLGSAPCVCRLWRSILANDLLWERLCFRNVWPPPPGVRPVVAALGGYKRLYVMCVRPVLGRLDNKRWTRHEVELSLSLFCVEYYERLGGGKHGGGAPASLMFLCEPVNV